jgi:hypothetical protein
MQSHSTQMNIAPKRRWPRFSLRTLFVVVTVLGCWLGYQLNWIRQRHDFLARNQAAQIEEIWTKWKYEPRPVDCQSLSQCPWPALGFWGSRSAGRDGHRRTLEGVCETLSSFLRLGRAAESVDH